MVRKFLIAVALIALISSGTAFAQGTDATIQVISLWETILKRYVSEGKINGISLNLVDYEGIAKDPDFADLIQRLERFSPHELVTEEERKTFWINVYNIFATKMVVDHYPVESIRDIGSLFKSVWKKKVGRVDGKEVTLNQIEHKILRKMGDPRIHAAIVCASLSCPDLQKEAFIPARLSDQLDEAMKNFIENPEKGVLIDQSKKIVYLSSIFKWFRDDFKKDGGTIKFIQRYVPSDQAQFLNQRNYKVKYLDYDWSLNTQNTVSLASLP